MPRSMAFCLRSFSFRATSRFSSNSFRRFRTMCWVRNTMRGMIMTSATVRICTQCSPMSAFPIFPSLLRF